MSVLVLQSDGAARDHLISSLETQGFNPVRTLATGSDLAAALVDRSRLSAILVDLALDQDLAACQQIRAVDASIPLLVVFDEDSATRLEAALKAGATGCISEPLNPLELAAKLRAAIRQHPPHRALSEEQQENEPPSGSDPLTKLATERSFQSNLDRAWRRDWRSRTPLSLIVLNIDHFAQFNQIYGRSAGDDCLRLIASAIQGALFRPDDLAAHRGSGEFLVLLSGTNRAGAAVVAERLRARVLELAIPHAGSTVGPHVTMSVGVGTGIPSPDLPPDDMIAAAERALSQAKLRGRNQAVVQQEEPASWLA